MTHIVISEVTARIRERSVARRQAFLARIQRQAEQGKTRAALACGNLAHAVAACSSDEKGRILDMTRANVGIVTAYNDMLSAHQPYQGYPDIIKAALAELGHSAQVAGGVPAMCDGVTQGQPGMDMSLFSRDLIAQATALSLSHNTFDATLLLGICDKIAPGQIMGALSHAHLPTAFVPAGPMASGISNDDKVKVRQQYAAGELGRDALLEMECGAYHAPGTCTFYGTANTNQLVFEAMGLMLPGSAFVHPHSELRHALTEEAARRISAMIPGSPAYRPLSEVLDERSLVNGLVALLASGGSTNHSIHMVALARAAGLHLTWDDISDLSDVVPLLVRMYPNGPADVNAFEQAGGVPGLMRRLAQEGLIHMDATPVFGEMQHYLSRPALVDGELVWQPVGESSDASVLSPTGSVFQATGGTKLLAGNLGRAVVKASAVAPEYRVIEAPARVFSSQHAVEAAYKAGSLNQDAVIVVRHNGPAVNGMPELHKLMPVLGNLQKAGHKVALVTDGRLSGASGKIPAAIHVTPEALHGGAIGLLRDGDLLRVDAVTGRLDCLTDLSGRTQAEIDLTLEQEGWGRELFSVMRRAVSSAECGATIFD
ncbi:phosphogluconate dehydratase [Aeromonas salmonicida subsp. salmonicida]|uniref:Phosphogluconate dehydratase n=3 Tax=Aeromonas salmonicida TaxID=645 RepID=A4ST28_AERS4|nr:phosphogluconate dehydratase [Aeromonas salmonicida]ABO92050.1 phosphogluconate dehydratase [Aeromonas salmonicida subsp. salmonicida A449]AYO65009.1 phosphogluconate dehydratase [Aeromonas salmonicida subsp. salmonicida 01-B526]EHI50692.1 phosphogluconate dehydratase [Aeromonas salmonicida subsp. salmonicida 01-B526]EKP0239488.1 phosphogluconate dehydratase [Aeromonas salmonicida]EKP0243672.1 phosphogluconate dehydratase [Aeromonas salmonicida]